MASIPKILFVLSFLFFGLAFPQPARSVDSIVIEQPSVDYVFARQLSFRGILRVEQPVRDVTIFWQQNGDDRTQQGRASINSDVITYKHDLTRNPLRPFASVTYWFGATFENGDLATSETFVFQYEDNRFTWQSLDTNRFHLHWVAGDLVFAQQALDSATAGWQKASALLPLDTFPEEKIDIYIYPSSKDLQEALQLVGYVWVGGHADPALGVMLISLPPGAGQQQEMERQIPHELMHILLYRYVNENLSAYQNLPVWLNEGLASINELNPSSDYVSVLLQSGEQGQLLPMISLCRRFPTDTSTVIRAYAQSAAFTRYLQQQFGATALQSLIKRYADGLECERGAESALGLTLSQIEQRWLEETFKIQPPGSTALSQHTPTLILVLLVVGLPVLFALLNLRTQKPVVNRSP